MTTTQAATNAAAKLTDEQIDQVWQGLHAGSSKWMVEFGYQQFARAIESAVLASLAPAGLETLTRYRLGEWGGMPVMINNAGGDFYKVADVERWAASHASLSTMADSLSTNLASHAGAAAEAYESLFSDLKSDDEKANFFLSGRGYETGVIAIAIQNDVAMAYRRCANYQKELTSLMQMHLAAPSSADVRAEGWISVDERLPEPETDVLIVRLGQIRVGAIFIEHELWEEGGREIRYWDDSHDDGQGWDWCEVTHWMPLPAAPATDGEKGEAK